MDEVYLYVREFNFLWCFVLLMVMVYFGIVDAMMTRRCHRDHSTIEGRVWAVACLTAVFFQLFSLAEILVTNAPGGYRVFVTWIFLGAVTVAVVIAGKRVRKHRLSVARGDCR